MRIAIITDIHGNLEALTRVLADIDEAGVDRLICLGDIVGYGANPNECCDLVRGRAEFSILGNHDAAVAGRMDYSYYYDAAKLSLDWCAKQLTGENMAYLRRSAYTRVEGDVTYCHGAPLVPEDYDYVFAPEQARALLNHLDAMTRVTFIGHSHLCKTFALAPGEVNDVVARRFGLRKNYSYLITVGSTGQPRDYDNRACWGLFDDESQTFEYRRVEYDIERAAEKIVAAGLSASFGKRLFLGV